MSRIKLDRFGKPIKIKCPLLDNELIPDDDCFVMTTIADGITPDECIEKNIARRNILKIYA